MSMLEIHIRQFDGPMDLLLYLVQKEELHPSEISIAEICDQFLVHIQGIEDTNLSTAGDFLFMASRLMALKARQLLPRDAQDELEMIEFDEEREALIRQVLLYQKFKEISEDLRKSEEKQWGCFGRGRRELLRGEEEEKADEPEQGIWELYRSFHAILKKNKAESVHTIEVDHITIEDCQQSMENQLKFLGKATFEELLRGDHRRLVQVVHFMALMEMVKTDHFVFRQSTWNSLLWVYRKKDNLEHAQELSKDITDWTPDPELKSGLAQMLKSRIHIPKQSLDLEAILQKVEAQVALGDVISDRDLNHWLNPLEKVIFDFQTISEFWLSNRNLFKEKNLDKLQIQSNDFLILPTFQSHKTLNAKINFRKTKKIYTQSRRIPR